MKTWQMGRPRFFSPSKCKRQCAPSAYILPLHRCQMFQFRDYWTPQILPFTSAFQRPSTPNLLLGSGQTMNGPAISRCP